MTDDRRRANRARSVARRLAMQALYQWQLGGQPWQDVHQQFASDPDFAKADAGYFRQALMDVATGREALDRELAAFADIPGAQLDPVERALLWLGLWELIHRPDVPYRVVINEAVDLARRFGATEGHKFVNAVLDRASRVHRAPERGAA
ncbi:MAG: transcription antitermination factor NusB [Steroidobacteraceae bacterium]|jgi:N utilization substance protein B|nr:transcription antitermination factor NusB [Steroidobacteraceae bacterium]